MCLKKNTNIYIVVYILSLSLCVFYHYDTLRKSYQYSLHFLQRENLLFLHIITITTWCLFGVQHEKPA